MSTRGAVLRGAKPDLQNRFPRGAANYRSFVPQAYSGGGSDTLVLDGSSVRVGLEPHVFTLTTDELPRHQHGFGPLTHDGLFEHSHTIEGHSHGMDHLHQVSDHTHSGVPTVSVSPVDGSAGSGASNVTTGTTNTGSVNALPSFRTLSPIDAKGKPRLQTDLKDLTTSTTKATLAPHPAGNTLAVGGSKPIQLPHKLTVTTTKVDIRPAYLDVVYLIRVK